MDNNKVKWSFKESVGFVLVLTIFGALHWFIGVVFGAAIMDRYSNKNETE